MERDFGPRAMALLWWASVPYTLAVPLAALLLETLGGESGWTLAHGSFVFFLVLWFGSGLLSLAWVLIALYRVFGER